MLWAIMMIVLYSITEHNHISIPESDIVFALVCIFLLFAELRAAWHLDCSKVFMLILLMTPIAKLAAQFFGIKFSVHPDIENTIQIVNFIQLLYLNWIASTTLKSFGIRIGFMGANSEDLMQFARVNR
ncbi:MAG: hypothetical protein ACXVB6_05960 [Mucilaginibacter sp.]